ncbi:hypothetical protein, partial [Azospirillum sp. B4]|uniref:hypothetical protein n=1 Tax=Azospirillum sp. B4 TaxID=95605 RepID=UPI001B3BC5FE
FGQGRQLRLRLPGEPFHERPKHQATPTDMGSPFPKWLKETEGSASRNPGDQPETAARASVFGWGIVCDEPSVNVYLLSSSAFACLWSKNYYFWLRIRKAGLSLPAGILHDGNGLGTNAGA